MSENNDSVGKVHDIVLKSLDKIDRITDHLRTDLQNVRTEVQGMAVEMATKFGGNIRVNAIAPGFFVANQNRKLLIREDGGYTERGQAVIDKTPMNRFGSPEELNGALHWLISDASSFVTGTVVSVDGGFGAFSGV